MTLRRALLLKGIPWKPEARRHPDPHSVQAWRDGKIVYVSSMAPIRDGEVVTGKIGGTIGISEGKDAAANSALQCLYAAGTVVDLDRIVGVRRMWVDVNCTPDFSRMSEVADGASEFLVGVFDDWSGCVRIDRAAISLPGDAMVMITMEVLVRRRRWWGWIFALRVA